MRKTAIDALHIGQQFRADIRGSVIRNGFVSMITCRTRREVARIQSDSNEFGKLAEALTSGLAVWLQIDGNVAPIAGKVYRILYPQTGTIPALYSRSYYKSLAFSL